MRIALDATPLTLTSGGLRRYTEELSLALALNFPDDTFTFLSDQAFSPPFGSPANLQSVTKPGPRYWSWGICSALRELQADVFHGTNFEVPYLGRTPAVLTIHDLSPWKNRAWHGDAARVRQRTPWLVRLGRAKLILTVSAAMGREIGTHFSVPEAKIRVAPLAASDIFRPAPEVGSAPHPYFLFVGTLEPRKNLEALVEAWQMTRHRTGAELWVVGRERADFVPLPDIPGLTRVGEVHDSELPGLYSRALAFVYPTHYEGFGLPVLEAMQCGCPVITSNDAAVKEVSGGAAIHAGNVAELAEALVEVAAGEELRAGLRAAGIRRAQAFSWKQTAIKTHSVYEEAGALR